MKNLFSALVSRMNNEVADQVRANASLAMESVMAQVPLLDDLLDGKPVEVVLTIQLRRKE